MDSLKSVAVKVKRSPQIIRKKLKTPRNTHEELREDCIHQKEALLDGVPFYVKNLGSAPVTIPQGLGCTDDAVKQIVNEVKKIKKLKEEKLQRLMITVTAKKLTVEDLETEETVMDIPIYRISYCTADPNYSKVFAFISREKESKKLICHAYLTSSEQMAQALSLTVADAFNVAFEMYEQSRKQKANGPEGIGQQSNVQSPVSVTITEPASPMKLSPEGTLIQLADEPTTVPSRDTDTPASRKIQALDLATDSSFDEEFTRLAESRSNPNLFETPVRKSDFSGDVTRMMASETTAEEMRTSNSHNDLFLN